jgi:NAD(P)-dependent dehydrogenase (short-subunit alcohol dehydrogenase family)
MKEVAGKVAVITGAASGIGRGMAEAFAAQGMRLVLSDVERVALEATADSLSRAGSHVHAVVADVSKAKDIEMLAEETLRIFGAVHVLCNNAGVGAGGTPSWTSTLDDWNWVIGVNLMGVVHGVRTFLPIMIKQDVEAHIVNTASMAGLTPGGGAPYAATKFAVVAFSEIVYQELTRGGFKPRMSVLCPGFVSTNILDSARNRPAEYSDQAPPSTMPGADAFRKWFADQVKSGLDPRTVGDQVLQAIRDERFYVFTHPDWLRLVEHRTKQIMQGENPKPLPLPEMESAMRRG